MSKWWKQIASHPVGANALGGVICSAILAVLAWLWSASNFSTSGALIWSGATSGLRGVIGWLAVPITVSRLTLWIVIGALVSGWLMAARARQRLSRLATHAAVKEHVRDTLVAALKVPVKLALPAAALTYTQRLIFHVLYRQYPGASNLSSVGGMVGLHYPAAEKLLEEMAETGLIEMNNVMDQRSNRTQPMVRLTKDGRNYCLENGLDRQPSQDPG
jgi:DNA-binding MarR family transcriptional regulator